MDEHLIDILKRAQAALENMPSGGIGSDGPTMEDIVKAEASGGVVDQDAGYHQAQKAWLFIEFVLLELRR